MSDQALTAYREAREDQLVRNEARRIRSKINDARGSRHDAARKRPRAALGRGRGTKRAAVKSEGENGVLTLLFLENK